MNQVINKNIKVLNLGIIDYKKAWDYQEKLFAECIAIKLANRHLIPEEQKPTPNHLVFCQHPHVYTLGKSGTAANLLIPEDELGKMDARYYKINRGGDITYHGPGQIICYPIIDLENFFTDIHKYLRCLEEAVISTCDQLGITAGRIKGLTGVWIDFREISKARKICAFGVKTSRWVTMHGLALNVNTNLSYFNNIIPCGIEDKAVTSLEVELGQKIDLKMVQELLLKTIIDVFKMSNTGTHHE